MQVNRGTIGQKRGYEHVQKSVETCQGGKVTILWNQQIQIDRTIPNNKPDIIISDNEKVTYMLIDIVILGDRNVTNPLTPNDPYRGSTAPLTSKRCILYIYSTNIGTEYFKHGIYCSFFLFRIRFVS